MYVLCIGTSLNLNKRKILVFINSRHSITNNIIGYKYLYKFHRITYKENEKNSR